MEVARFLKLFLAAFVFSTQAFAQSQSYLRSDLQEDSYRSRLSIYYFNKTGAEVLRQVKLLGNVNRPGIYHVPENTDLTTLLAIAGGTSNSADTQNVLISNPTGVNTTLNLREQLASGKDINLKANDIIFVPEKKFTFDPNSTNNVMVITTIISLLLTTYVVFKPTPTP